MSYQVLIATTLSPDGLAVLEHEDDLNLRFIQPAALSQEIATAEALIVDDHTPVTGALLAVASRLKMIGCVGAVLDQIDIDDATRRGIMVMNIPGVAAVTVVEYTFAMMLTLARNMVNAHNDLADGVLDRGGRRGTQLHGKILGIVGLGRVGREMARRALAFGMDVIASDPYVSESQIADLRIKLVSFSEVLERSHIITLHTSAVPETHQLINAKRIARMRPGVFLINSKHADLMNEADVLDALNSGQIAGVATDVYDANSPLLCHPRVIHTLRMRDNTHEAQRDLSVFIAHQIVDALRGQDYRNAVNLPFMPGREYEKITYQLVLAERIGVLLHALGHQAPIDRVLIEVDGEEMQGLLKPLSVALLKGLLAPALGAHINYINAPVIAAERGIMVTQTKMLNIGTYPNLFSCQVYWKDGFELIVAGALFNKTEPRIVQLDRYRTDFTPEGTILIMGSYDVPGVIGKTGTYMADHGINIAGWRTSRAEKGGNTLTIMDVDESLSAERLQDLRSKDFVRHATQITF